MCKTALYRYRQKGCKTDHCGCALAPRPQAKALLPSHFLHLCLARQPLVHCVRTAPKRPGVLRKALAKSGNPG